MYAYTFNTSSEYVGPFTTKGEAINDAAMTRGNYLGDLHIVELVPTSLMNVSALQNEIDSLKRSINWHLEYTFTLEGRASDTLIDDSDYFFDMLEGWMKEQAVLRPAIETQQTVTLNWLTRLKLLIGKPVL
jgi:hypothetical protein